MRHHTRVVLNIVAFIAGVVVVGGLGYAVLRDWPERERACTLEAKICPDGTAVGRRGPTCKFDACPATNSSNANAPIKSSTNVSTNTNSTVNANSNVNGDAVNVNGTSTNRSNVNAVNTNAAGISKACLSDAECILDPCTGCYAREPYLNFVQHGGATLACVEYPVDQGYTCACRNQQCAVTKGKGDLTYEHRAPDFRLTFPEAWRGYRVTGVATEAYDYVAFTYPVEPGIGSGGVVEFSVLWHQPAPNMQTWTTPGDVLGERNGLIFRWQNSTATAPPDDELARRWNEIADIVKTFTFTS